MELFACKSGRLRFAAQFSALVYTRGSGIVWFPASGGSSEYRAQMAAVARGARRAGRRRSEQRATLIKRYL